MGADGQHVSVAEPPEPETPAPSKPGFEQGKFAFLTAVTQVSGQRQAWISLRAEGKLLKLFEGDQFEIGDVTVKVARIDDRTVELDSPQLEQRWSVKLGQSLERARAAIAPEGT